MSGANHPTPETILYWACLKCREGSKQKLDVCPTCGGDMTELHCRPMSEFGDSVRTDPPSSNPMADASAEEISQFVADCGRLIMHSRTLYEFREALQKAVFIIEARSAPETIGSLPAGTKVELCGSVRSVFPTMPADGWEIETVDEPRLLKYRIRHPSGGLLDVRPEDVRAVKAPEPPADQKSLAEFVTHTAVYVIRHFGVREKGTFIDAQAIAFDAAANALRRLGQL